MNENRRTWPMIYKARSPLPPPLRVLMVAGVLIPAFWLPAAVGAQHIPALLNEPTNGSVAIHEEGRGLIAPLPRRGHNKLQALGADVATPPTPQQDVTGEVGVARVWLGGLAAGAFGAAAGAAIGLATHSSPDSPVIGGLAGYTLAMPAGVHVANRRSGEPWKVLLASTAGMGLTYYTAHRSSRDAVLPVGLGVQLLLGVAAERLW